MEGRPRPHGQRQSPPKQNDIQCQCEQPDGDAELLAQRSKDEIALHHRHHRGRALAKTQPRHAAGSNGDQRLDDLVPAVLRGSPWIFPDRHARLHMGKEPVEHYRPRRRARDAGKRQQRVAGGDIIDRQARQKADQHRAQILLQHNQPNAQRGEHAHRRQLPQRALAAQIQRQAHNQRDFDKLGGLQGEKF